MQQKSFNYEKSSIVNIQLIYLGPIEGVLMYFSDAVVVQVPANVSHKLCFNVSD